MNIVKIHLNLFDAGGSQAVVNATTGYVNGNTGETTAFGNGYTLDPGLKEYYDTDLLENSRDKRYFAQFGLRQALPKNKGKTMEWRKWDTLPPAMRALQEGVAPHGRRLGETYVRKTITQHGDFVRKSDVLDLHFVDDVGLAATEELGSAAAQTQDLLIRNELLTGTNVMVADEVTSSGVTANTLRWKLKGKAYLTSDMVAQCVTKLEADKVPELDGRYYVCVIHPYQHTGLHIGDGKIIHCSNGVQWGDTSDKAWTHYAIPAGLYTAEEIAAAGKPEPEKPTESVIFNLRRGSKGSEVTKLQQALNDLGYDCGAADGIFGAKTAAAVRAFQADNGLAVDGIAGKATQEALYAAESAPRATYTVTLRNVPQADAVQLTARYGGEMAQEGGA